MHGGQVVWNFTNNTFPFTKKHYVVIVGSGSDLKIYVDGELKTTGGSNTANYGDSTYDFNIGGGGIFDPNGNWFDGDIHEVAVWDTAIPAEGIAALYNGGDGSNALSNSGNYSSASNIISYWTFDEGSGGTTADLGGNGNHGTINGATWIETASDEYTYTPNVNFNGSDSFVFSCDDGSLSDTATVSITITAVNDAPVATAQSVTTVEDTPISITLSGTDVEGADLTFTISADPSNGTISGIAPNLTYTPTQDFTGSDNFSFTVNDGSLTSEVATVSITVQIHTTIGSGDWDNAGIWNTGQVPSSTKSVLISSGHTVAVPQSSSISMQNLTIASGGTLNSTNLNTTITVKGNWDNSGTFLSGNSSTVTFSGTSDQTVDPGGNGFFALVLDNTGNTIIFSSIININGSLMLTAGTLDLSTSNPTISIGGNLTIANGAVWTKGSGIVTFDGSSQTYSDNNTTKQNIGNIQIQ